MKLPWVELLKAGAGCRRCRFQLFDTTELGAQAAERNNPNAVRAQVGIFGSGDHREGHWRSCYPGPRKMQQALGGFVNKGATEFDFKGGPATICLFDNEICLKVT